MKDKIEIILAYLLIMLYYSMLPVGLLLISLQAAKVIDWNIFIVVAPLLVFGIASFVGWTLD